MANKTINTNQLTPGKNIMVRGRMNYCRITSQIAGDELKRSNDRARQYGRQPDNRPFTKAVLENAYVECINPNNPTVEEAYAIERLYVKATAPQSGNFFEAKNKGRILPWVGIRTDATNVKQLEPSEVKGELDRGLDVTLVLRVFNGTPNNGVSLDGIIVNEPIRFYNGANANMLAEHGITIHPAASRNTVNDSMPNTPKYDEEQDMPYGNPSDMGTPVKPPSGDPYSANMGQNGQPDYNPYGNVNGGNYGGNGGYGNAGNNAGAQTPQGQVPNRQYGNGSFTGMNQPEQPAYQSQASTGIRYTDETNPQGRNYGMPR